MAMEYFIAYHSYLDAMQPLTDAERGRLFVACLEYSKSGAIRHLSGNERFIFPMIKAQIDRDMERYKSKCKKQSGNVSKRWNKSTDGDTNDTMVYDGIPSVPPYTDDTNDTKEKTKTKEKAKAKAKEKDNISSFCAELPSSPAPQEPPVIALPLIDGTEYAVTEAEIAEMSALYPAVDVMQAYRSMRAWLLSNPKNRKTRSGISRFVNGWLAKDQNSSRPAANQKPQKYTKADELSDYYAMVAKWANDGSGEGENQ